jgi:hypothetical protein
VEDYEVNLKPRFNLTSGLRDECGLIFDVPEEDAIHFESIWIKYD